jgi:group I intron endonuclease
MNKYGQIYKVTNKIDSKVYIGKTIRDLEERLKQHIDGALKSKKNNYFYNAIKKYGKENFTIESIEQALDKKSLDILEKYYVAFYRKLLSNNMVYNMTNGGDGNDGPRSKESNDKRSKALLGRKKGPMSEGA